MTPKKMILLAVSAAALAVPAAASAQEYYRQQYGQEQYGQEQYGQEQYGRQYYGQPQYRQPFYQQPQSDWRRGRSARFGSYPEFRPLEMHIRQEIQDGVRDDMLAPDDAQDLMGQLRQIQAEEMREYRVHGWNLPNNDRARIRAELNQLDQVVDQTRNES